MSVFRVGLTGGIAAGKSTVARLLAAAGAEHVDADRVAHTLLATPGPVVDAVVAAFGEAFRAPAGIDRGALAARVFADSEARARLEGILHPAIRADIDARGRRLAEGGFDGVLVVEAALLVETGRAGAYDLLVVVEAPVERKIARQLPLRSAEEARARIDAQAAAGDKCLAADVVLWNDGDEATLEDRCRELMTVIDTRRARGKD